jgi:hypothetical protein
MYRVLCCVYVYTTRCAVQHSTVQYNSPGMGREGIDESIDLRVGCFWLHWGENAEEEFAGDGRIRLQST